MKLPFSFLAGSRPAKDPYAVLGLSPGASLQEVEEAYLHLWRYWNPESNPLPGAAARHRAVRRAGKELLAAPKPVPCGSRCDHRPRAAGAELGRGFPPGDVRLEQLPGRGVDGYRLRDYRRGARRLRRASGQGPGRWADPAQPGRRVGGLDRAGPQFPRAEDSQADV